MLNLIKPNEKPTAWLNSILDSSFLITNYQTTSLSKENLQPKFLQWFGCGDIMNFIIGDFVNECIISTNWTGTVHEHQDSLLRLYKAKRHIFDFNPLLIIEANTFGRQYDLSALNSQLVTNPGGIFQLEVDNKRLPNRLKLTSIKRSFWFPTETVELERIKRA